ncbi:galectin-1-like [Pteronotus mesoamericanus]|uniref:galectin-1-like n=1 Tax=Pteronotus mesoamericanus TaxID=1884717 RepID=UPI0023EA8779|nr:galectin-1-like [Pteronotus parnellii mesoamericanus]
MAQASPGLALTLCSGELWNLPGPETACLGGVCLGQRFQGGGDHPHYHVTAFSKLPHCSLSAQGMFVSNMNLKLRELLRVQVEVAPDAKGFRLNLGKDVDNLCLHFNPRFQQHGDVNTIVCNSKKAGVWDREHRESAFPFQLGSVVEVCIAFDKAEMTIKLPDGHTFKFPNRLNMETIDYMAIDGDIKIKSVSFE